MKKYSSVIFLAIFTFVMLLPLGEVSAQCPMCRMSAESNLSNGGSAAKGLNNGILYIFAFPYILVSILGFVWWRYSKKNKAELEEESV